ncbi:hypothetical protein ACFQ7N_40390 [Streptomyces niveus]|uniref:hypothetical protein n=1 Tax=Streptomyces niveus TaxID=193462 RepID=UPI0036C8F9FF
MSRTWHHSRPRPDRAGNPGRALASDDRAAARKGILKTAVRVDGWLEYARNSNIWAKPGVRKSYQVAAHRRDRAATRAALSTNSYRRDPASRHGLRMERATLPRQRRSINWEMS